MAVAKRSSSKIQLSKNRKKGWKKYSNINDVEEYLEDQRFDEIIGGPVSEKPSEEIFFLDKETKFNEVKKPNKKKEFLNELRCFSALKNPSKVLPPIQVNVVQPSSKKRRKTSKSKSKVNIEQSKQPKVLKSKTKNENESYDIWDNKVNTSSDETELDNDLLYYIKETTKNRQPKVPIHRYQKPSLLPAVEIPPPGTSYNPEYTDHIKLLSEVAKAELEYERDYNKIERALTEKFPTIDEAPNEKTWLEEMSQGLKTENTNDDEDEAIEDDVISCNPPVRFDDKKSKQKRRREKELKEQLKEKKKIKLENKRKNEIYRLRSLNKQILNEEKRNEERKIHKDRKLIQKMYEAHTLSKHKYEAPDPEFNLNEDITGELRTIKIVGNLLEDRYKSFQKRNIIETRIRQKMKRKYKLKVYKKK